MTQDKYGFDPLLQESIDEEWWHHQDQLMERKASEANAWYRSQTKRLQDELLTLWIIDYLEREGYWDGKR